MPWYPGVKENRLPWTFAGRTPKNKFILHTSVGGIEAALREWRKKQVLWSTFYVELDGTITQFCDSGWHAQANGEASASAISVETEDHGRPERQWDPWSRAQITSLIKLIKWAATEHRIPLVRCPSVNGAGVGFHSMFGKSDWNKKAHECPAAARIAQFNWIILPAITGVPAKANLDVELGGYRGAEVWTEVDRMRQLHGDGVWLEDILRSKFNSARAAVPAPGSANRTVRVSSPKKKPTTKRTVRRTKTTRRRTRRTRVGVQKRAGRRT